MNHAARIRARRLVARVGRLEDVSAREQQRLLRALRRDVLAALGSQRGGLRGPQLRRLLTDVDRLLREGRAAALAASAPRVRAAVDLGASLVAATTDTTALAGTSASIVRALVRTTTEQLTDVWRELGVKLRRVIRQTVTGLEDPYEAQQVLARELSKNSTYARAESRAETIVRTETNRTFSAASHDSAAEASAAGGKVYKWWLTAGDSRVRDSHVEAGRRYSERRAIPQDEPFIVGGSELLYPLDPNGAAAETINCRCVALYEVRE